MKRTEFWYMFSGFLFGVATILILNLFACGIARADPGIDTDAEYNYVIEYGASAVCPMIAANPDLNGVVTVWKNIVRDGFTVQSAGDIIDSSVWNYCPQYWPLLNEVVAKLRGNAIEKRAYA